MKNFKLFTSLILIALLSVLLIACGGNANDTDSNASDNNSNDNNNSAEANNNDNNNSSDSEDGLKPVKVVVPRTVEVLDDAHVWAGIKMGYFEDECLDVSIEESFGTTDVKMVSTGNAEFALPAPNFILM